MTAIAMSPLHTLAGELMRRETWPREQLLAHQRRHLDALIAHAVEHSPYYRDVLGAGEPPVLTKRMLMDQWDRIVCDPRLRRAEVEAHAAGPTADQPYLGEYQVFSTRSWRRSMRSSRRSSSPIRRSPSCSPPSSSPAGSTSRRA